MVRLFQFTSVVRHGRAILIAGPPGSGKSSLALALVERGAMLVGDDGVDLAAEAAIGPGTGDSLLIARAPVATRGRIEVRGAGILRLPFMMAAPVALLLRLDPDAPRFIEGAGRELLAGIAIPTVTLYPDGAALPARAEMALAAYGLRIRAGPSPRPLPFCG